MELYRTLYKPMGGHLDLRGWSCKGSTRSSPNSLYPALVGDMQRRIEKEQIALIPLIRIYAGMQQNTQITKMQWKYHFISLIKELKLVYIQNGNKLATLVGSLSLRRDVAATCLWTLCYNEARRPIYYWETMETLHIQKPNPRRWNARMWAPLGNLVHQFPEVVTLAYYLCLMHMIHH